MTSSLRRTCLCATALVFYGSVASAGDPPTAEALFRAGREASNKGDAAVACQRFKESYRLDPAPGTLLNIAVCNEGLNHLAAAWEGLQHVMEALPAGDERRALVKERLDALEKRLPRLTLQVDGSSSKLEVLRDGVVLSDAAFGVSLPVDPGEHRIVVTSAGRQPREYMIAVTEGAHLTLRVQAGAPLATDSSGATARDPAVAATSSAAHSLRHDAAYGLMGAGIAGLITSGIMGAIYLGAVSDVNDHCPTTGTCDEAGLKAAGTADRLQVATLVTGGLAVAALAGGVTLWALDNRARERQRRTASVAVGPGFATVRLAF